MTQLIGGIAERQTGAHTAMHERSPARALGLLIQAVLRQARDDRTDRLVTVALARLRRPLRTPNPLEATVLVGVADLGQQVALEADVAHHRELGVDPVEVLLLAGDQVLQ